MHPYVLLPLCSTIVCVAFACTVLGRDPSQRATRLNAAIILGAGFWALCEVIWNSRTDPESALWFVRLSAVGWVGFGPLALDLLLGVSGERHPRIRRSVPWLYATSGLFLAVTVLTPWTWKEVVRTGWGWGAEPGPGLVAYLVFALVCGATASALAVRVMRDAPGPGERRQAPWVLLGMGVTTLTASVTDVVLPLLGHHVPRLGSTSFIVPCAVGFWLIHRFGYFLITPGVFTREVVDRLPVGVGLLRLDGTIKNANPALDALCAAEPGGLVGRRMTDLTDAWPEVLLEEVWEKEGELRDLEGESRPIALTTTLARDRQGLIVALLVLVRDLREVVTLRQRLVTSGRLAAVGELAAGIAHEINNPMAYVRANLIQLRDHWTKLVAEVGERGEGREWIDDVAELFDDSLEGVERTASIVREIKGFAAVGEGIRENTNPNALLDTVLRVARPQTRFLSTIERDYGRVPMVSCNPQELKQVFLNLVINATQAVDEDGHVRAETRLDGDSVVISIEDDGKGIAPEHLERIFDPFFTTKPAGQGTGLGLSISYEIVRKHGGEMDVVSRPGKGTRFSVRLPTLRAARGDRSE